MADDQFNSDLNETIRELTRQLAEYSTITRRHIGEQEKINRHLTLAADNHDERLRDLEKWQAVLEATMPKKWLNAEAVEAELKKLRAEVSSLVIKAAIAGTFLWLLLQVIVVPLGQMVMSKFVGVP